MSGLAKNLLTVFCLLITYDCRNAPLTKPVSLLFLGKKTVMVLMDKLVALYYRSEKEQL